MRRNNDHTNPRPKNYESCQHSDNGTDDRERAGRDQKDDEILQIATDNPTIWMVFY